MHGKDRNNVPHVFYISFTENENDGPSVYVHSLSALMKNEF